MLIFAGVGQQINAIIPAVPDGYRRILVYEEPTDPRKHRLIQHNLISATQNRVRRDSDPREFHTVVGFNSETTAETLAATILSGPEPIEVVGIVPGIFGFEDVFVAEVAHTLGVPYAPLDAVRILNDKTQCNTVLRQLGFPTPQEAVCDAPLSERADELSESISNVRTPVVLKPSESAGSIGAFEVDPDMTKQERRIVIAKHIADIQRYNASFQKTKLSPSLVQERIDGAEFGIHAIINKDCLFALYTLKKMHRNKEVGHYFDPAVQEWGNTYMSPHLPRLMARLGLNNCFFNGDAIVPKHWADMPVKPQETALISLNTPRPRTSPQFHLLDGQARLGGDGLAVVGSFAVRTYLPKLLISVALGHDVRSELSSLKVTRAGGVEVGFPAGGALLVGPRKDAATRIESIPGLVHVNAHNFMSAGYLQPLTNFFDTDNHPTFGVYGNDMMQVRERLNKAFHALGAVLIDHEGILSFYHPADGLCTITNPQGTTLGEQGLKAFYRYGRGLAVQPPEYCITRSPD